MERRFEEHNRIQNGHLASIGGKLADLSKANTDGREERSKQIGDLRADIVERFNRILLTAIVFGLSLVAGLLYTILR